MKKKLEEIFSRFPAEKNQLIPILQEVQKELGFLSREVLLELSEYIAVPESQIYSVATFYDQFRFTPIGRQHVMVCRGTACHVKGASNVLDDIKRNLGINEGETTPDGEYSLETVACIGCCSLSPCITINQKVIAKLTTKKIAKIFGRGKKL